MNSCAHLDDGVVARGAAADALATHDLRVQRREHVHQREEDEHRVHCHLRLSLNSHKTKKNPAESSKAARDANILRRAS